MKPLIGLLGGCGSRASAFIYQRVIDCTLADKDSDFPKLLVYNLPVKNLGISCKPSQELITEIAAAAMLLTNAGCKQIWLGCNSLHVILPALKEYSLKIVDMPKLFIKHYGLDKTYPPLILGSETTDKHELYPGDSVTAAQQLLINVLIQNIIRRPPNDEDRRHLASLMHGRFVVLACTELSVIYWSMSSVDRLPFNVIDTVDFIAKQIAK